MSSRSGRRVFAGRLRQTGVSSSFQKWVVLATDLPAGFHTGHTGSGAFVFLCVSTIPAGLALVSLDFAKGGSGHLNSYSSGRQAG